MQMLNMMAMTAMMMAITTCLARHTGNNKFLADTSINQGDLAETCESDIVRSLLTPPLIPVECKGIYLMAISGHSTPWAHDNYKMARCIHRQLIRALT